MRITFPTMVNDALTATRQQTDQLATLQQQAATGNKINVPSDDPVDTPLLLASQVENSRLSTYLSNIQTVQGTLNQSVSSLQDASNILAQAKSIAIQATNSGNDTQSLTSLAQEVDQLLNRLIAIGNTQQNGHYLYGGTASTTPPFTVVNNSQGQAQNVTYTGSAESTSVPVGDGQSTATYYSGSQIFQPPGGPGAFAALINLRDTLLNTAGPSSSAQLQSLSSQVGDVDQANNDVLQAVGKQGADLQNLQSLQQSTQNAQLGTQEMISNLKGADMAQVAVGLQEQTNLLQMTLASTARLFNVSLLDYIQ